MKKIFYSLLCLLICFVSLSEAKIRGRSALTGGTSGALDNFTINDTSGENSTALADGDLTLVMDATTGKYSVYYLDIDGTLAEDSPKVIRPDDYTTGGNWLLAELTSNAINVPQQTNPSSFDLYEGTTNGGLYKFTVSGADLNADRSLTIGDYNASLVASDAVSSGGDIKPNRIGDFSTPITTNPYTLAAADSYNSILFYGATGEIDLPAGVDKMSVLIYNTGAFTITIDPNGSEVIVRDGTAQTGGVSITLSSGAGNFVCLMFDGTQWVTLGYKGTLAEGS